jgi:histidinol phosphatase-like PHP family hydrolase
MSGWQPTDCHAHSRHSDGALTVAEVVARAAVLGTRPSITDHISRDAPTEVSSPEAVVRYLDDLDAYPVLRGGEFCWHDALWRELPDTTVRRFTHRIGSLHSIRLPSGLLFRAFSSELPASLTARVYIDAHVSSLESLAAEMPVDILAHPTLVPPPLRRLDPLELWTEEQEERAVAALKSGGIAFEVSARYPPHERIVRRAAEAGVRLSLGSDGHRADQVANVTAPLALTRRLGVADEALYDPERHGSRTGAFDADAAPEGRRA